LLTITWILFQSHPLTSSNPIPLILNSPILCSQWCGNSMEIPNKKPWFLQDGAPKIAKLFYKWLNYITNYRANGFFFPQPTYYWGAPSCRECLILPSGKLSHNYGTSSFLMGKSTISIAIFNSYVSLTEGKSH
jgi:hypothetical protein